MPDKSKLTEESLLERYHPRKVPPAPAEELASAWALWPSQAEEASRAWGPVQLFDTSSLKVWKSGWPSIQGFLHGLTVGTKYPASLPVLYLLVPILTLRSSYFLEMVLDSSSPGGAWWKGMTLYLVLAFPLMGLALLPWERPKLRWICLGAFFLTSARLLAIHQAQVALGETYKTYGLRRFEIRRVLSYQPEFQTLRVVAHHAGTPLLLKLQVPAEDRALFGPGANLEARTNLDLLKGARNPGGFSEKNYYSKMTSPFTKKLKEGQYRLLAPCPKLFQAFMRMNQGLTSFIKGLPGLAESEGQDKATGQGRGAGPSRAAAPSFRARSSRTRSSPATGPSRAAGLLLALFLGQGGALAIQDSLTLRLASLSHLCAVSGMHLSFLLQPLQALTRKSRKIKLGVTCLVVLLYNLLCGFKPSLVRASFLRLGLTLASYWGLRLESFNFSLWGLFVALLLRPVLLYDLGFCYSYFTTMAIIQWTRPLKKFWGKAFLTRGFARPLTQETRDQLEELLDGVPTPWSLGLDSLSTSLAAMGVVFPLALIFSAPWSLGSLLLGAPATLLVEWAFQSCLYASLVLPLWPSLAALLFTLAGKLMTGMIALSQAFLAYLPLDFPPLVRWLFLGGGILIVWLLRQRSLEKTRGTELAKRTLAVVLSTILLVLLWIPSPLYMAIDVGQGDAHFLSCEGVNILLDGGDEMEGYRNVLPVLQHLGRGKIDLAILSHPHKDHYSGILELMDLGYVKALALAEANELLNQVDLHATEKILSRADALGIPCYFLKTGDELRFYQRKIYQGSFSQDQGFFSQDQALDSQKGIAMRVYWPPSSQEMRKAKALPLPIQDANQVSLVTGFDMGIRLLATGDLTKEVEALQDWPETDLLKIAHHGSKHGSTPKFLQDARPQLAVISVGSYNRYGHPAPDLLRRVEDLGIPIWRTDEDGAIIFKKKRGSWQIIGYVTGRSKTLIP